MHLQAERAQHRGHPGAAQAVAGIHHDRQRARHFHLALNGSHVTANHVVVLRHASRAADEFAAAHQVQQVRDLLSGHGQRAIGQLDAVVADAQMAAGDHDARPRFTMAG